MTDHFAYLIQDKDTSFFAEPDPVETEKVASFASRAAPTPDGDLRMDLDFIKRASPGGIGFDLTMRGFEYFCKTAESSDLTDAETGELFDKVAAFSIENDLEAARQSLYAEADTDDERVYVDDELRKVGASLSEAALLEKVAIMAALRHAGRALGHVTKKPFATAKAFGGGAAKAPVGYKLRSGQEAAKRRITGIKGDIASSRAKMLGERKAGLSKRFAKIKALKATSPGTAAMAAQRLQAKSKLLGAKQTAAQAESGYLKRLSGERKGGSLGTAKKRAQRASAAISGSPSAAKATPIEKAKKTTETAGVAPAAKGETKPKGGAEARLTAATEKAREGGRGALEAATGGAVAIKDSVKKLFNQGWGSLSGSEKARVVGAGAGTVAGTRALSGRDVITGEKN